jgi:Transglycosylase
MTPLARRVLGRLGAVAGVVALLVAPLLAIALRWLQPADGQWRTDIAVGPWHHAISLPVLLRFATHPLGLALLDGRVLRTEQGTWQLQRRRDGLEAVCTPCAVRWAALGPAPLQWTRVSARPRPMGANRFSGELLLVEGAHEVSMHWLGKLTAQGAELELHLPPTPAARVVGVLSRGLPEAAQVQVEGTVSGVLRGRWPDGPWRVEPAIDGLEVSGLATERLRDAQRPAVCRTAATDSEPLGGWLPRALVAAEDARFFEHPGYDLAEMLAALQHNASAAGTLRGGSTLTQQLAKLAFTGDDRSATRKLRELLYAVEMERTLGKARILQLYLALAPWGEGVCGAERAAQVYLGKPVAKLGPVSSAWLVSLLRNPDAQLHAWADERRIDRDRVRDILAGMRPMTAAQRALAQTQIDDWLP